MHSILLTLAATALPILALVFVAALLVFKLYIKIRSRYNANVNCWFCNVNTRVPFPERNSWTCPHCEQYNGFNKDGDYNRDMLSQRDCSAADRNNSQGSSSGGSVSVCANAYYSDAPAPPALTNGLCDQCNEAQRLKVEKLAQFEPKHESRFERELNVYKEQLEKQFRLCTSCENHVNKVLREKKKMVLGSKLLNFIIKGAALLKQPHFNQLARAQQQRKLLRYQRLMALLTLLNILCLLCGLPLATRDQFAKLMGDTLAWPLFIAYSHLVALARVLSAYAGGLWELPALAKLLLYARTFGKLLLFSVGLTQAQAQQATLCVCFTSLYPYAMLALTFLHNITDGAKFTRFSLLLVLWSIYAKGSPLAYAAIDGVAFMLLGSCVTMLLIATNRANRLLLHSPASDNDTSFHRLCADDCFSDEDTISMLSQQLSCTDQSSCNNTLRQRSSLNGSVATIRSPRRAPSMLSLDSLHLSASHKQHAYSSAASSYATPLPQLNSSFTSPSSWRSNFGGGSSGYQRQQQTRSSTSNLLMPSRFSSNALNQPLVPHQLQRQGDVSAWVAANSSPALNIAPAGGFGQTQLLNSAQLSRTSSQSSGFESQLGQPMTLNLPPLPSPAPRLAHFGVPPQLAPSSIGDYGWPTAPPPPQLRHLSAPLLSPAPSLFAKSNQSELGRSAVGQPTAFKQGDLLRKWMDRSGAQKTGR